MEKLALSLTAHTKIPTFYFFFIILSPIYQESSSGVKIPTCMISVNSLPVYCSFAIPTQGRQW